MPQAQTSKWRPMFDGGGTGYVEPTATQQQANQPAAAPSPPKPYDLRTAPDLANQKAKYPSAQEKGVPTGSDMRPLVHRVVDSVLYGDQDHPVHTGMEDPSYSLFAAAAPGGESSGSLLEDASNSPLLKAVKQFAEKIKSLDFGLPAPRGTPKQLNAAPSGPIAGQPSPISSPAQVSAGTPPATPPESPIDVKYRMVSRGPTGPQGGYQSTAPVRGLLDQPPAVPQLPAPQGLQLNPMAAHQPLPPAPGAVLPPGTTPMAAGPTDPMLPSHYAAQPAGQPAGPGIMGGLHLGEEGGIPARGEQTVTPQSRYMRNPKTNALEPETRDTIGQAKGTVAKTVAPIPVNLPDGTIHTPSSLEMERGYVITKGPDGKFMKVSIDSKAPTPPPKGKK